MSWAPHPFQAEQNPLAWPLPWWDQGRPGARCPQPKGHRQAHPGGLRQQGLAVGGGAGWDLLVPLGAMGSTLCPPPTPLSRAMSPTSALHSLP